MAFLDNVGLRHLIARLGDLVGKKNGIAPLDWQAKVPFANLPEMIGAEEEYSGATGTVPAPQAGDQNKYLKGDGTWSLIDATSVVFPAESPEGQPTDLAAKMHTIVYTSSTESLNPNDYPNGTIWLKQKASS